MISNKLEKYKQDLVKSLQESIKIRSVEEEEQVGMPFGQGPYKALDHILNLAEEMGFKVKNLDGYAGYVEFGQGEETLAILGHIDVVPEGEGWTYPAYGGEIHNNRIYGRGAIDDKGPTLASLYAMKALLDSGIEMNKKVRLIIGANEETNWKCMEYYFEKEEEPDLAFTPDGQFPVVYAEKGVLVLEVEGKINRENDLIEILDLEAGVAANVVPEKAFTRLRLKNKDKVDKILSKLEEGEYKVEKEYSSDELRIKVLGKSAHGSRPELGLSALDKLMDILNGFSLDDNSLSDFLKFYKDRIGHNNNGEKTRCNFKDEIVGPLTFNPGKMNLLNDTIKITIDVRYPIKYSSSDVVESIRSSISDYGFKVNIKDDSLKPLYVPENSELVQTLSRVFNEEFPGYSTKPLTMGGATYARVMENAVAFGPVLDDMESLAHQKDEYIEINHLFKLLNVYYKAIYELTR